MADSSMSDTGFTSSSPTSTPQCWTRTRRDRAPSLTTVKRLNVNDDKQDLTMKSLHVDDDKQDLTMKSLNVNDDKQDLTKKRILHPPRLCIWDALAQDEMDFLRRTRPQTPLKRKRSTVEDSFVLDSSEDSQVWCEPVDDDVLLQEFAVASIDSSSPELNVNA